MPEQWEYRVESMDISDRWSPKKQRQELERWELELNALGSEGWEMISYQSVPLTGRFSGNVNDYAYLCFFKRRLS